MSVTMGFKKETAYLRMPWEDAYGYAQAVKVGNTICVGEVKQGARAVLRRTSAVSLSAFSDTADGSRAAVYTAEQAARGKVAVESSCAICHVQDLRGRVGAEDEVPFNERPARPRGIPPIPPRQPPGSAAH
jgi:cytochrome c5